LPDFWYKIANHTKCLRLLFLDHFNEPDLYCANIRKEQCCSNCNTQYQFDKIKDYYCYTERGNGMGQWGKAILKSITAWAEKECITVMPTAIFSLDVNSFLSQEMREQLAKDAHEIMNITQLQLALKGWQFFDTHGEALFTKLRYAYWTAREKVSKRPKQRKDTQELSQCSQKSILYSQPEVIWTPSTTPLDPPWYEADINSPTIPLQSTQKCNPLSELSTNITQKCLRR
jgi:hypothetical protein